MFSQISYMYFAKTIFHNKAYSTFFSNKIKSTRASNPLQHPTTTTNFGHNQTPNNNKWWPWYPNIHIPESNPPLLLEASQICFIVHVCRRHKVIGAAWSLPDLLKWKTRWDEDERERKRKGNEGERDWETERGLQIYWSDGGERDPERV